MTFDWLSFFREYLVAYATTGKNHFAGCALIRCPFCGDADPSAHLNVHVAEGNWWCWRGKAHRGRAPAPLVRALLGTDGPATAAIVARFTAADAAALGGTVTVAALKARLRTLETPHGPAHAAGGLSYPAAFRPADGMFLRYLAAPPPAGRGYGRDAPAVAARYGLLRALSGDWAYRLVIPLYERGVLVAWQGRHVGTSRMRYLTAPDGPEAKRHLWNYDGAAAGGRLLVLCEGPLDAMRVDFYGRARGVRAVALMGVNPTARQLALAHGLCAAYPRAVVLFDRGAEAAALAVRAACGAGYAAVPAPYKDPGELPRPVLQNLTRNLLALPLPRGPVKPKI